MAELELASTQAAVHAPAQAAAVSARITIIDQWRGVAMILMALEHSTFLASSNVQAESFGGVRPELKSFVHVLVGEFTHLASGIFFMLMGVSVGFFETSRRKRGWTEGQITRFFLIRALILLILDQVVNVFAWHEPITFDVLSAVAVDLIILAFVRRLRLSFIAILAIGLFLLFPVLVQAFPYDPNQPLSIIGLILVGYRSNAAPYVEFSVLGRLSLVLFGYVCGRLLQEGKLSIAPRLLWVALAAYAVSFVLRLLGGYGNFLPYQADWPLIYFFIENKQPPSIVFLLYNFAGSLVILVSLKQFEKAIQNNLGRVLTVFGQTSLFFYVVHLMLYSYIISKLIPYSFLPQATGLLRAFFECAVGLVILYPVCVWYRSLRQKHPNSVLQYL